MNHPGAGFDLIKDELGVLAIRTKQEDATSENGGTWRNGNNRENSSPLSQGNGITYGNGQNGSSNVKIMRLVAPSVVGASFMS